MSQTTALRLSFGLALVTSATPSFAVTRLVPAEIATIQAAIDSSASGDTVLVAAGSYAETIDFAGKDLLVRALDGPLATTIDASGLDTSVVVFGGGETRAAVLDGFTLTGGNAAAGGGLRLTAGSAPTILRCIATGNGATRGGGAFADSANPVLAGCLFHGNDATDGGALYVTRAESLLVLSSTISRNTATDSGSGILNAFPSSLAIANTIVWDTGPEPVRDDSAGVGAIHSNVAGGLPGTGNLDADPRFADPNAGDFSLLRYSPSIDAGDSVSVFAGLATDLAGNPRRADDSGVSDTGTGGAPVVDMGAYERQIASAPGVTTIQPGDLIQDALALFPDGELILVEPGTYVETLDFLGKSIAVRSTGGHAVTTLDADSAGTAISFVSGEAEGARFEGFTITRGKGIDGGAIAVTSSAAPTLRDLWIEGNEATRGGGVFVDAASPTVLQCVIARNIAEEGAGIYVVATDSLRVLSTTIVRNTAATSGGGLAHESGSSTFANTIVWDNDPDPVAISGGTPVATHCNVQDGWPATGDGNIASLPRFTDLDALVLGLARYSPCIDSGDSASVPVELTTDFAGNPRAFDDSGVIDAGAGSAPIVDMGAFERQSISSPGVTTIQPGRSIQSALNDFPDGELILVEPGTYVETIDFLGKAITLRATGGASVTTIDAESAGTGVTIANGEGAGTILEGFTITGGLAPLGGGIRIDAASPIVRSCILDANVAMGTTGAAGAAGGDGRGGGIHVSVGDPLIEGCTFVGNLAIGGTGGGAPTSGGDGGRGFGGGLDARAGANPVIVRSFFAGNEARAGAGGSGVFPGDPGRGFGGGINAASSVTIDHVLLSGNVADDGGGGVLATGTTKIVHATLSGNVAALAGGISATSGVSVTNTIVWNNVPDGIGAGEDVPAVTFSLVQRAIAGTGNVVADPLFVDPDGADDVPGTIDDDLHVATDSPCVDAGSNAATLPGTETDHDGGVRLRDGDIDGTMIVDIGPYEVDPNAPGLGAIVWNFTQGTIHDSIGVAIGAASEGDRLGANLLAYTNETSFGFGGKGLALRIAGPLVEPDSATITLAPDALLAAGAGDWIRIGGALAVPTGDSELEAEAVVVDPTGSVVLDPGANLEITGDGGLSSAGSVHVVGRLAADGPVTNLAGGAFRTSGFLVANVTNLAHARFEGDSYVVGDYTNADTTRVVDGTLTVTGTLTNDGEIIGQVSGARLAAKQRAGTDFGLVVDGDLALGPNGPLRMPSPSLTVRCRGDLDGALTDGDRWRMATAELRMDGAAAGAQSLERMSLDEGPTPDGLVEGPGARFPFGTLRIGPTATTVTLIDARDNDGLGQATCEAIYADSLIVEPGATLVTNGCPVYYGTLVLAGSVDDSTNLVAIGAVAADDPESAPAPRVTALFASTPNPAEGRATIRFDLATAAHARIRVFDVAGRLVTTLVDGALEAGRHRADWDGRDAGGRRVASGVYLYRMDAGGFGSTRRLLLVR